MKDSLLSYELIQNKQLTDFKYVIKKNNTVSPLVYQGIDFMNNFNYIFGPCAIESTAQVKEVVNFLKKQNLKIMRGGIIKLRTSPYSFQGIGDEAFKIVKDIIKPAGIILVSEISSPEQIAVYDMVDILMIGARNMQNIELLKKVAQTNKVIILKRNPGATLYEFLASAELIASLGNNKIILCERGIRTFDTYNRYTIDLGGAIYLKSITTLPVIIDPSHAMGRSELILPLARATKAAGLDGLLIEMHPHPEKALSDKRQQITLEMAERILKDCEKIKF